MTPFFNKKWWWAIIVTTATCFLSEVKAFVVLKDEHAPAAAARSFVRCNFAKLHHHRQLQQPLMPSCFGSVRSKTTSLHARKRRRKRKEAPIVVNKDDGDDASEEESEVDVVVATPPKVETGTTTTTTTAPSKTGVSSAADKMEDGSADDAEDDDDDGDEDDEYDDEDDDDDEYEYYYEDEEEGEETTTTTPAAVRGDEAVVLNVQDVRSLVGGTAPTSAGAASSAAPSTQVAPMPAAGQASGSPPANFATGTTRVSSPADDSLAQLLADAKEMQSLEEKSKNQGDGGDDDEGGLSIPDSVRSAISTLVTVDFFVVCGFLLWFLAGIFSSAVLKNDAIQIAFNGIFEPLVQPALGILMISALVGAVIKEEDDEK